MRGLKLTIDPIPMSSWGISLASKLGKKEWDKIRHETYFRAGYQCEICGNVNEELHAHEQWRFEEVKRIQRLVRFECCCKLCHDVHHLGRSSQVYNKDYVDGLIGHWCRVNERTPQDFAKYQAEVFELSKKRANRFYTVKVGRRILV